MFLFFRWAKQDLIFIETLDENNSKIFWDFLFLGCKMSEERGVKMHCRYFRAQFEEWFIASFSSIQRAASDSYCGIYILIFRYSHHFLRFWIRCLNWWLELVGNSSVTRMVTVSLLGLSLSLSVPWNCLFVCMRREACILCLMGVCLRDYVKRFPLG